MQAAGLDGYVGDLGVIFTVDWLLDRIGTAVNVLSDAYGAAIVHHICADALGDPGREGRECSGGPGDLELIAAHSPSPEELRADYQSDPTVGNTAGT